MKKVIDTLAISHSPEAQRFVVKYFNESFVELLILGIFGVLIHVLLKIQQQKKKGESIDYLGQLFNVLASSMIVAVIVYVREDIVNFLPLTKVIVVGVGYSAQSVFINIMKVTNKKTDLIDQENKP